MTVWRNEMARKLRFFLYRDDAIVSQFLEQLEGGRYEEENIRRQAASGGSVGGGIGIGPASVRGSRDRSTGSETEFSLQQTGSSRFSRFHDLAAESEEIQSMDAIDEEIWNQVESGELIEARVNLEIPAFLKSIELASQASALLPFFDVFGSLEGEDGKPLIDPNEMQTVKRQLPAVEQAAAITEDAPVPIVASLVTDPKFKFFVRLKREMIQAEGIGDLEGEARLVGSIQSKVARGKPEQVGQLLPGLLAQNRAQRRRSGSSDSGSVTLRYPAAVVTPVAIFR
jgi:hypothetical protein